MFPGQFIPCKKDKASSVNSLDGKPFADENSFTKYLAKTGISSILSLRLGTLIGTTFNL